MNRKSIITLPHTSLRDSSKKVDPLDPLAHKLAQDMMQATLDWEDHREHEVGVALAAVQVDQKQRIVVVRNDPNNKLDRNFTIYFNPEITRVEGEPIDDLEGCLSVVDIYGMVPRYPRIKVKAQDSNGRTVKLVVKGFQARLFQHEIDHTNGITFCDRIGHNGIFFHLGAEGKMTKLSDKEKKDVVSRYEIS